MYVDIEITKLALAKRSGSGNTRSHKLFVKRIECNNLKCFEMFQILGDKSDVYVTLEWCGSKAETAVHFEAGNNPVFADELVLAPVNVTDNKLIVKVFDKNNLRPDVLIGETEVMLSEDTSLDTPITQDLFNSSSKERTGSLSLELCMVTSEEADKVLSLMLEKISSDQKMANKNIQKISAEVAQIMENGNKSMNNLTIFASELPKLAVTQNVISTAIENITTLAYQISSETGGNVQALNVIKEDQTQMNEQIQKISTIVTTTGDTLTTELPALTKTQNITNMEIQNIVELTDQYSFNQSLTTEALKKVQADQSLMSATLQKIKYMGTAAAAAYLGVNFTSINTSALTTNNISLDTSDNEKLLLIQENYAEPSREIPTLVVHRMECQNLKNVELIGKNDVYVVIEWYNKKHTTAVIKNAGQVAVFDTQIELIPAESSSVTSAADNNLHISVYEQNMLRFNKLIGKTVIHLADNVNPNIAVEADIYDRKEMKTGEIKLNVDFIRKSGGVNEPSMTVPVPQQPGVHATAAAAADSKDYSSILEAIQRDQSLLKDGEFIN